MSINLGNGHANKFQNLRQQFERQVNGKTRSSSLPVKPLGTKTEVIQKGNLAAIKDKIGDKLQHAFSPPQGLNGKCVNANVSQKVEKSSQLVSFQQADRLFNGLVQNVNSLQSLPNSNKMRVCQMIRRDIQSLIIYTDRILNELNKKDQELKDELVTIVKEYTQLHTDLQKIETEVKKFEVQLTGLNSQKNSLDGEIAKTNTEIVAINTKIKKEAVKRSDAVWDLIPFVGFFSGIFTRRYKRMIPFHSLVEGVISVATQELENHSRKLKIQKGKKDSLTTSISSVSSKIGKKEKKISDDKKKIQELDTKRTTKDGEIKKLGNSLATLRETNKSLKLLPGKYKFLDMKIEFNQELIEFDMFDSQNVSSLTIEVQKIKQTFSTLQLEIKTLKSIRS